MADWAVERVTPTTIRILHELASGFGTWFVYFGVIDPTKITACADMQGGGHNIENWRDMPEGRAKPVPPERRHVFRKS